MVWEKVERHRPHGTPHVTGHGVSHGTPRSAGARRAQPDALTHGQKMNVSI